MPNIYIFLDFNFRKSFLETTKGKKVSKAINTILGIAVAYLSKGNTKTKNKNKYGYILFKISFICYFFNSCLNRVVILLGSNNNI